MIFPFLVVLSIRPFHFGGKRDFKVYRY